MKTYLLHITVSLEKEVNAEDWGSPQEALDWYYEHIGTYGELEESDYEEFDEDEDEGEEDEIQS